MQVCLLQEALLSCGDHLGFCVAVIEATVVDSQAAAAFRGAATWCCGVHVAPRNGSLLALPRHRWPLDLRSPVSVARRCLLPMQHQPRRSGSCSPSSHLARRCPDSSDLCSFQSLLACIVGRHRFPCASPLCLTAPSTLYLRALPGARSFAVCPVAPGCHLPAANPLKIWRLRQSGQGEISPRLAGVGGGDARGRRFPSWRPFHDLRLCPSSSLGETLGPVLRNGRRRRLPSWRCHLARSLCPWCWFW